MSQNSSPIPDSPTGSGEGLPAAFSEGGDVILFESYLYKIPKSLLMKWSKKYFTLKRRYSDMNDPGSIELSYYKDSIKKEKRRVIDLTNITGIRPTPKMGSSDHIFAIETVGRKYILKAADEDTKNIWLAKLCEFCGQEQVYHVTVPNQPPVAVYNEAILKLSSPTHVTIVLPSTSEPLLTLPYKDIRRMGYLDTCNSDIIWFETCVNSRPDHFFFFVVPSGIEVAKQIVQELKSVVQSHTSSLLILEDSTSTDMSFIARDHYGCQEYSQDTKSQIIQMGMYRLPALSWKSIVAPERIRRDSTHTPTSPQDVGMSGVSLEEFGRRKSKSLKGPSSHSSITRRPTLDKFVRNNSITSFDRQTSTSSFDRSLVSTPSLDRETASPSLHDLGDSHYSSGSGSDVFDVPFSPHHPHHPHHPTIQRNLSLLSSVSSQGSTYSSTALNCSTASNSSTGSNSPTHTTAAAGDKEEITLNDFRFETLSGGSSGLGGYSSSCSSSASRPAVPPRSMVSLQQDHAAAAFTATAH